VRQFFVVAITTKILFVKGRLKIGSICFQGSILEFYRKVKWCLPSQG